MAAPLASFGGIAVGERRASDDRPAKSAVLGIVAGALGIERDNDGAHTALAEQLFCAVRIENFRVRTPRRLMTDYHTAQAPPRGRNQRLATRRDELINKQSLGTILSYREYRSDCSFSIALWPRVSPLRFGLDELAKALRNPIFVPYAGRKACPLMLPCSRSCWRRAMFGKLLRYAMGSAKSKEPSWRRTDCLQPRMRLLSMPMLFRI